MIERFIDGGLVGVIGSVTRSRGVGLPLELLLLNQRVVGSDLLGLFLGVPALVVQPPLDYALHQLLRGQAVARGDHPKLALGLGLGVGVAAVLVGGHGGLAVHHQVDLKKRGEG